MVEHSVWRVLVRHFFRRFFDNDTVQVEGDTTITMVRALAFVAAPGLIVAFFLQNQYPRRSAWGAVEDQYFFVLLSFVVMGVVAIFEWEMLFPDRLDFLVLSPLGLRPWQMLGAKATALVRFLAIFLVACNCFGGFLLPAVTKALFWRHVLAYVLATGMAGVFAALLFVAVGGVLLCVLNEKWFRLASPLLQMLSVMALVLLLVGYAKAGDNAEALLSGDLGWLRWVPPLWFLGVYQRVLHGAGAAAFALPMSRMAVNGLRVVMVVVAVTYPLAWARMRRMAVEGASVRRGAGSRWVARVVDAVVRRPGERAIFRFIGQTMARNNHYQVYLAMYCGTGLAIAVACAVSVDGSQLALSQKGLHAVMPLLLFWVVAGLRVAFGFPLNLAAGWIFRVTGVNGRETESAERRWVFIGAMGVMATVLAVLLGAGWGARALLVQAVVGVCLAVLLTDGFFCFLKNVPFNRKRLPGKTSLPLMLTLYIGVFPPFVFGVIGMEKAMERHLAEMIWPIVFVALVHMVVGWLRRRFEEVEEEMEGYDGEFQLLNLS